MATTAGREAFNVTPLDFILRAIGLHPGESSSPVRRALLSILVSWVPLVILAQVQGLAIGTGDTSVLADFGAYARFLLAVPLMVIGEGPARVWLNRVLAHFTEAHLVPPEQQPQFEAVLATTRRRLESRVMLLVIVCLAFGATLLTARDWVNHDAAGWVTLGGDQARDVSYAGWWRLLVSQPLFCMLGLVWIWRIVVWSACLRGLSRLQLVIVASHPDRVGGLGFLSQSLRAFPVFAFAIGFAIAGTFANLVVHEGRPMTSLTPVVAVTVAVILALCVGPLAWFIRPLREAQDDGELTYGSLATSVGRGFERKWLTNVPEDSLSALEVPDFSATTDLFSVVANVREMKIFPMELRDFIPLMLATTLPFLPVILRQVPTSELLDVLRRLLV